MSVGRVIAKPSFLNFLSVASRVNSSDLRCLPEFNDMRSAFRPAPHTDADTNRARNADAAVLLINLGTPDTPAPRDVRRYLAEFLSDPRVVELPAWLATDLARHRAAAARP